MTPQGIYVPTEPSTSQMGALYFDTGPFKPTHVDQEYVIAAPSPWVSEQSYATGNGDDLLRDRFAKLSRQWEKETLNISSVQQIVLNSNYQAIIGMGPQVIPLILDAMQEKPGFWFWALISLTGENPANNEVRGDIRHMTEAWLEWGRQNAYL